MTKPPDHEAPPRPDGCPPAAAPTDDLPRSEVAKSIAIHLGSLIAFATLMWWLIARAPFWLEMGVFGVLMATAVGLLMWLFISTDLQRRRDRRRRRAP